jgi:hypothetical protein
MIADTSNNSLSSSAARFGTSREHAPMVQEIRLRHILVLRPWLSTVSGGDAYAHFDALVMREAERRPVRTYGDYRVIGEGDDGRKTLRLDRFRFQCQIDGRREESYAWQWGYQPANGSIFGPRDMELYGPSIAAINRGLDRSYREDGVAEGVGRYVVRLARVLKLDGIVLLETSQTGSFRDELDVTRSIEPGDYGEAIRSIESLVTSLHRTCAQRMGRIAA